jgi:hypothetical protein
MTTYNLREQQPVRGGLTDARSSTATRQPFKKVLNDSRSTGSSGRRA